MEKAEFAIQVVFIGFLVVLITLFLLYVLLSIFGYFFHHPKKDAGRAVLPARQGEVDLCDAAAPPAPLAAAIAAAVYLYLQEKAESVTGYRISSIQRSDRGNKSNWAAAGRKARLESRCELEVLRRKRLS
ncbi:MAG: OadG family transporter subunit [Bacillota bacterium]